jgi:hypothetical protein
MEDDENSHVPGSCPLQIGLNEWKGPRRRMQHYGGKKLGGHRLRDDVERWPNGAVVARRDKFARQATRAAATVAYSSIETSIAQARRARIQIEKLASNSHEKKRYLDQVRDERRNIHVWWGSFLGMWSKVGSDYARLLIFARNSTTIGAK